MLILEIGLRLFNLACCFIAMVMIMAVTNLVSSLTARPVLFSAIFMERAMLSGFFLWVIALLFVVAHRNLVSEAQ